MILTLAQKLQILLAGAVSSAELQCHVSYIDHYPNSINQYGSDLSPTTGATAADLTASIPDDRVQREVTDVSIFNADDASATVTVRINDGSSNYKLITKALGVGQSLLYSRNTGWVIIGSSSPTGNLDFSGDIGAGGDLDVTGNVTVGADITATGAVACDDLAAGGDAVVTGDLKVSVANALTAHAGGGQGSALALTKAINRVTTVGTAGDSVVLPAAVVGKIVYVANAAAANSMDVFPASGEGINALANDAAFAMAANKRALFFCAVAGKWSAILTA